MMSRAAIVFLAFAVPAFAQHGGARSGSAGGRGFSGRAGFSSSPAFSHSSFSGSSGLGRPATVARYGSFAGYRSYGLSGLRSPYNANRFSTASRRYSPSSAAPMSGGSNRGLFDARRRDFRNWYVNTYWPGYPYLFNPNLYNLGLYDWSEPDDSSEVNPQPGPDESAQAYDANEEAKEPASPYPPYPNYAYAPSAPQAAPAAPLVSRQPLTVVFKSGRTPIKVENYMMTANTFTDLDPAHYEQIPLDQINLAATQLFNNAAGVDFQIPSLAGN